MTRAFLDANVIFAAAISPDGSSATLVVSSRRHELVASAHVIGEAQRNVAARYPSSTDRLDGIVAPLARVREAPPELVSWASTLGLPLNDAPVLAAAVHVGVDVLVTGDRTHFGSLFGKRLRGVEVITLRQAVERLGRP